MLCIQMPWHVQDEMASAIRDGVQELREKLKVAEADSSYSLLHSSKTQTWDDSRTYAYSRLLGKASQGHLQTEWTWFSVLILLPSCSTREICQKAYLAVSSAKRQHHSLLKRRRPKRREGSFGGCDRTTWRSCHCQAAFKKFRLRTGCSSRRCIRSERPAQEAGGPPTIRRKTDSAFAGPSMVCTRGDVLCIQMPWHVQDEMASAIRDGVQELREKLKVAEAGLDDSQV